MIAGADEYAILLPIDNAEMFAAKLELIDQPLVSWQAYRVKPNESLPQIAAKYGMSAETLLAINGIGPRTRVPPGHTLLVPSQRASAESADSLSQAVFTSVPSGRTLYYTVRRGDTLPVIAARYGVTAQDVRHWNNLMQNKLDVGQRIKIVSDAGPVQKRQAKARRQGPTKGGVRQVREALTPEALARLSVAARAHLVALAASSTPVVHYCNLHSHASIRRCVFAVLAMQGL